MNAAPSLVQSSALFRDLLASSFAQLPEAIQRVHRGPANVTLSGVCKVARGKGRLTALMAWIARLPPAGEAVPVTVTIERNNGSERWVRRFGEHQMISRLSQANGQLCEALGPVRLVFNLQGTEQGIQWKPAHIQAFGIPLPRSCFRFDIQEWVAQDRYSFDVRVALPGLGLLVHYQGWLDIDG